MKPREEAGAVCSIPDTPPKRSPGAREIYEREIRAKVESEHAGRFVVVDVTTGSYELDERDVAASDRALAKNPDALLYFIKVGRPSAYRIGAGGSLRPSLPDNRAESMRGTASGEAVLTVRVVGEDERSADVEAVIDTGFDGHLLLPPSVVSSLSLPRIGSARPTLADGSVVLMTVHVAEVLWHGRSSPVRVLADKGGAALVGMALLRGSRVRVVVVPGSSVLVEEL